MVESRAAIRYAKAVLSLASDQNTTETVNNDMKQIASTITESKHLSEMLQSHVISSSTKKAVLTEVFKTSNKTTLNLIDTLISNKRVNILRDVANKYNQLFDASNGVQLATITTAIALTDALKKQVLAKAKELTSKDVEVKNIIDENIIGGFILRIGDIQYNASITNQLSKLKKEITLN